MRHLKVEYYTIQEVSNMLGLSRSTINRMIHNGEIPHPTALGKRWVWPKSGFDEWLREKGLIDD